jgi:hypothetical protein
MVKSSLVTGGMTVHRQPAYTIVWIAIFSSNHIFIDVDNLDLGVDFVEAIEKSVGSCDVLIAVIGKHWLMSSDEEGRRRLDNPEDFVRIEIATALKTWR